MASKGNSTNRRRRLLPVEEGRRPEIHATQPLHHVIETACVGNPEIEELHRVRGLQLRGDLRLAGEALPQRVRVLTRTGLRLVHDLHGRGPRQQVMPRQPDFAHPARSETLHQTVAADAHAVVEQMLADLQHGP